MGRMTTFNWSTRVRYLIVVALLIGTTKTSLGDQHLCGFAPNHLYQKASVSRRHCVARCNLGVASRGNGMYDFYAANSTKTTLTTGTLSIPAGTKKSVSITGVPRARSAIWRVARLYRPLQRCPLDDLSREKGGAETVFTACSVWLYRQIRTAEYFAIWASSFSPTGWVAKRKLVEDRSPSSTDISTCTTPIS